MSSVTILIRPETNFSLESSSLEFSVLFQEELDRGVTAVKNIVIVTIYSAGELL